MEIVKEITLDLLNTNEPALSATSDMPVIETQPDSIAKPQEAEQPKAKEEAKAETAAVLESAKTDEDESAGDLEQPESTSASDEPKKAKGVQKRLDELTRQREDERRRADSEQAEKLRLLALLEQRNATPEITVDEPVKPKRDSYETQEDFDDARIAYAGDYAAWKVRTEFAANQRVEQEKQKRESIAEQNRKVQQQYASRVEKFRETHPDYADVAEAPDVHVSIPMAHAIAHSEQGPEIAYFLGSNPEEASRIASLHPSSQLVELGKILAKINTPAPKPVSAAPPPIRPVKAGAEKPAVPDEDLPMEQYAAKRKKEWAQGVRH